MIREREDEPAPLNVLLLKKNAAVRAITKQEAEKVILRYEWLGTMPAATSLAVGLFFGENLAGVEVFTSAKAGGAYTLHKQPAICLARGACVSWAPGWAGSCLVRRSLAHLDAARFSFVVAYSDTEAGEIGTLYQASGFVCLGTVSNAYWLSPDGKRFDRSVHRNRAREYENGKLILPVTKHHAVRAQMESEGWRYVSKGAARYRYAEALGTGRIYRERRRFLESLAKPYPKRDKCQ